MGKKYLLVKIIGTQENLTSFYAKDWPLHLTLLMHFNTDKPVELLVKALVDCADRHKSFDVLVEGESLFGINKDILVSVLQLNKEIKDLHNALMSVAAKLGATYDEPNYVGAGFKPHVSTQGGVKLIIGQSIIVDDITLVEVIKVPEGKLIKVIKTFQLKSLKNLV